MISNIDNTKIVNYGLFIGVWPYTVNNTDNNPSSILPNRQYTYHTINIIVNTENIIDIINRVGSALKTDE